jgi:hypothetical protein
MMENVKKNSLTKKRLYLLAAVVSLILNILLCFVLEPIYTNAGSDVAVSDWLPVVMYYVCRAVEVLSIFFAYAVAIYGIYKFGARSFSGMIGIFAASTLAKYVFRTAVIWSYSGAVPSTWYMDLVDVAYFTALEVIQLLVAWVLIVKVASGKAGDGDTVGLRGLYDRKNALMRAALCASVVVFAVDFITRLADDVMTIIMFGAPERFVTVVLMVLAYLSTVIFGMICYLVLIFILSVLQGKDSHEA